MNWLNRAEARFGHLAIPGLPHYLVALNALVYVLYKLSPGYLAWLVMEPHLIAQGQVWRAVTFLFVPSIGGWLPDWLVTFLYLWALWFFANGVEQGIGAFKLNVFYLFGVLGNVAAAFIVGDGSFASFSINSAIFFAFARLFPDTIIYVMLILPMKVKWMAWFSAFWLILSFLGGSDAFRAAMLVSFANFFLFFGAEILQDARHRNAVASRRRRFESQVRSGDAEPLHRCAVCGRTEQTGPELEFRVARDGNEYCNEHLPKVNQSISA